MKAYQTILVSEQRGIREVILNRPEVHNAMNELMIHELTETFRKIASANKLPRLVVLRGNGKSFCAGADLNYMKGIAAFGFEENVEDGKRLATLFRTIYVCPVPTMAVVHGAALGGANGLLAACDIVIAAEDTRFAFSEVKLGISPSTIGPFVIKRIGEYGARELMLTGKRFDGKEAEKWHLVNHAVPQKQLEEKAEEMIHEIMTAAPLAVRETKKLITQIVQNQNMNKNIEFTAQLIARLRAADEGQEGMAAFLEKRNPNWVTRKKSKA
ncbi:MAG: enoyl-CoA hydratase [bacterium]|nr:MAG: enoyl-CoA hydratase [bacterium]